MSNPVTPTVDETLLLTDTSATALVVGGAIGASSGTGGIKAGAIVSSSSITDSVGSLATVRAGGIGIASQAALDLITAYSATQLARTAAGGALTYPRINSAANGWEFASQPISTYAATLANVSNSSADTATISFSVPLNTMADGNVITVHVAALVKNNKGSAGTPNWTFLWGAATCAQFAANTWGNSATEYKQMLEFRIIRSGADVWIYFPTNDAAGYLPLTMYENWGTTAAGDNVKVVPAATFTSTQTFTIKLQLSAADATFYFKPQSAVVTHFR